VYATATTLATQGIQKASELAVKSQQVASTTMANLNESGYLDTIKGMCTVG
jgi:hypothetical protein